MAEDRKVDQAQLVGVAERDTLEREEEEEWIGASMGGGGVVEVEGRED